MSSVFENKIEELIEFANELPAVFENRPYLLRICLGALSVFDIFVLLFRDDYACLEEIMASV